MRQNLENPHLLDSVETGSSAANLDRLLDQMSTSDTIEQRTRLAVYWETYGANASDTTSIAVRITRYSPLGTVATLANKLGLKGDPNAPVKVSWVENGSADNRVIIDGSARIIGRYLTLDISGLQPGDYVLEVEQSSKESSRAATHKLLNIHRIRH